MSEISKITTPCICSIKFKTNSRAQRCQTKFLLVQVSVGRHKNDLNTRLPRHIATVSIAAEALIKIVRVGATESSRLLLTKPTHMAVVGSGLGRRRRHRRNTIRPWRQRWVIAIKTKIQLPNTLPIIFNCVIGIINWSNWVKRANFQLLITN